MNECTWHDFDVADCGLILELPCASSSKLYYCNLVVCISCAQSNLNFNNKHLITKLTNIVLKNL